MLLTLLKPTKVTPAVDGNFSLDFFQSPGRPYLPPCSPVSWVACAASRHSSHHKGSASSLLSHHHCSLQSNCLSRFTTSTVLLALLPISAYLTHLNTSSKARPCFHLQTASFHLVGVEGARSNSKGEVFQMNCRTTHISNSVAYSPEQNP